MWQMKNNHLICTTYHAIQAVIHWCGQGDNTIQLLSKYSVPISDYHTCIYLLLRVYAITLHKLGHNFISVLLATVLLALPCHFL